MKKINAIIASSILLASCASTKAVTSPASATATPETAVAVEGLNILTPSGAPALSLIPAALNNKNSITTVEGPDVLQSELVGTSGYDVIIAPTNLGIKLASAGKTDYRMLAVVSWGNLYIVGKQDLSASEEIKFAAFGEQAVSGLVFKKLYPETKWDITWYDSVQDASAALLSGNADAALLAEPVATATIAKAKEKGSDLSIQADLQELWGNGYPQAGLFVKEDSYKSNKAVFDQLVKNMADYAAAVNPDDTSSVVADIDSLGADTFGMSSSAIIGKVWKRLNIRVVRASDSVDELSSFMELFGISSIDGTYIK